MKQTRRMKRMSGTKKKAASLSLVSLMDVFTILVFFLLTNSASDEVLSNPKEISLPEATVETKPKQTIVVFVSPEYILVQGEQVMQTADAISSKSDILPPIQDKLRAQKQNVIGSSTKAVANSQAVNILADKKIQFELLKKIMATTTSAGYGKISLAVLQKAAQN